MRRWALLGIVVAVGVQPAWAGDPPALAPWRYDPAFGARRNAYGPGVHMDATGGVYRDSVPDAWQFPPFRPNALGPGLGTDGTGRLVVPVPDRSER